MATLALSIRGSERRDALVVKAVHDWIIRHTAYDLENLERDRLPSEAYRATGVIDRGMAVCAGYAAAATGLLSALGIEVRTVTGVVRDRGDGGHAWNMVRVDGAWYHLDVTWDDPVPDAPGRVTYTWFLVSSATIGATRSFEEALPPAPNDYLASVDQWDGRYVAHSLDELKRAIGMIALDPGQRKSVFLWRLDPEAAVRVARDELKRVGSALASSRMQWWESHHPTLLVLDPHGEDVVAPPSGIRRPWFRLWSLDRADCMTVAARSGEAEVRLDRSIAKALFSDVCDEDGNALHKYFPKDGAPLLRFRHEGDGRWLATGSGLGARATPGNAMLHNGESIEDVWRPVRIGDRYQLMSWRRKSMVKQLTLVVDD